MEFCDLKVGQRLEIINIDDFLACSADECSQFHEMNLTIDQDSKTHTIIVDVVCANPEKAWQTPYFHIAINGKTYAFYDNEAEFFKLIEEPKND